MDPSAHTKREELSISWLDLALPEKCFTALSLKQAVRSRCSLRTSTASRHALLGWVLWLACIGLLPGSGTIYGVWPVTHFHTGLKGGAERTAHISPVVSSGNLTVAGCPGPYAAPGERHGAFFRIRRRATAKPFAAHWSAEEAGTKVRVSQPISSWFADPELRLNITKRRRDETCGADLLSNWLLPGFQANSASN